MEEDMIPKIIVVLSFFVIGACAGLSADRGRPNLTRAMELLSSADEAIAAAQKEDLTVREHTSKARELLTKAREEISKAADLQQKEQRNETLPGHFIY